MTEVIMESIIGAGVAVASSAMTWAFTTSKNTAVLKERVERGERETSKQWDRIEDIDKATSEVCGLIKELQAGQAGLNRMQDEMIQTMRDLRQEVRESVARRGGQN